MDKCIIFGCGNIGRAAYDKLKRFYEILAFSDNNNNLWGETLYGVNIIPPEDLFNMIEREKARLFVCMENTGDVVAQLREYGFQQIYVWKKGFFYTADELIPVEYPFESYKTKNGSEKSVLFISNSANIRDHKMASIAKAAGYRVFLAYIVKNPIADNQYNDLYEKVFPVMSMNGLINFINQSDFDVIHSSSEPDYLTPILINTNKPVIHDCHDLRSSNRPIAPNQLMLEYLAHKKASGVIYPSKGLKDEAIKKYGIDESNICVVENYVSRRIIPNKRLSKLSASDSAIHLVYEGGIAFDDRTYKYYQKDLWLRLVDEGMHVHFYSAADAGKCRELESLHDNIHYEGNITSEQLSVEMSKYDVGLCMFNVTKLNRHYLDYSSPNKLFEYLNAGIPVAVNKEIGNICDFVITNKVGGAIDLNENLLPQMKNVSEIRIDNNFIIDNGYYFEKKSEELDRLYKIVMRRDTKDYA